MPNSPGTGDFSPNAALFPQISRSFSTVSCLNAGQDQTDACLAGENSTSNEQGPGAAEALRGVFLGACGGPLAVQAAPA